ncbi:TPA: hypothetical protein KAV76_002108 [Escherichia coli]|nr:hypothetical protein [Escherichia coli]MDF8507923.1 hypothetical protein [Escherichia coli]HBB4130720.1 hypothetical protein [Escherichia coli]HBB4192985.1 hypothetical protein [Escherichia coli]HBB4794833.1 hypothetical protein [Escherichia coli]
MKLMSLIEMDGFLKGKCIPRDLKVNETNAEYLVRKFGELESKLETALRECRSAGITIDNLEAKCAALAAEKEKFAVECAATKIAIAYLKSGRQDFSLNTPATDAFLAEVRAQGVEMFAQKCNSKSEQSFASDIRDNWKLLGEHATDFAAELRKGDNQ